MPLSLCASYNYYAFDRSVIRGYLFSLYNCNSIVYFFKVIKGKERITKEVLSERTQQYQNWVEAYARQNRIPIVWAEHGVRKKDSLAPLLEKTKRKAKMGVYMILKSMEPDYTFRSVHPKYPTKDPNHMFIKKTRSLFTHYYFYLIDPILGPMAIRIASFLPFNATYYINSHGFIEQRLKKEHIQFVKEDNAIISVANPEKLEKISNEFSSSLIKERLDYWTFVLGPKFSKNEKASLSLNRSYFISQIEYSLNIIFKRSFPITNMFYRSCDMGLIRMTADTIAVIFGKRITKRIKAKLHIVLDKFKKGFFVIRAYFKYSFLKMYHKTKTFLRGEIVCNNLKDFSLRKSLDNLQSITTVCENILNIFADFHAHCLNNHFDFDVLAQLARPVENKSSKIPGIKITDQRIMRILEVLLNSRFACINWKAKDLYQAVLNRFSLSQGNYSFNQFRYDLRKLKAHGMVIKLPKSYSYSFSEFGKKASVIFILFHKRILGPIANSLFHHAPQSSTLSTPIEKALFKIDKSINELLNLIAA